MILDLETPGRLQYHSVADQVEANSDGIHGIVPKSPIQGVNEFSASRTLRGSRIVGTSAVHQSRKMTPAKPPALKMISTHIS